MKVELRRVETVYQGYVTLLAATLSGPEGPFRREIVHHGRAACVLPYDPARRTALMVNLPRAAAIWAGGPPELLEAPAGMVENEDPEETAVREAFEECGVRLKGRLEPVGSPFASPGVSSERVDLFLAEYAPADRVGPGGGTDGEHEHASVEEVPLAVLWAWVAERRIEDLKSLALILALRVRRPELFA